MLRSDKAGRRACCALAAAFACFVAAGCRSSSPPAGEPKAHAGGSWDIYRFDDHFAPAASVSSSGAGSLVRMAEPVVWEFRDKIISWDLVRGRLGFKPDQLIVKGENASPVIISPSNPAIDWSRYDSISIRMIVEAGREIKIKLGDVEMRQPLAPPMEWQVYRFDLNLPEATFTRPMAIMPTDDLNAPVAIDSIVLTPRKSRFAAAAGRANIGKREEYRNVIYARTPSSITYETNIPKGAVLRFGLGASTSHRVVFRILAGSSNEELFSRTISSAEAWEDAEVDLSRFGGSTQKLAFRAESDAADGVAFWANPLITTPGRKSRPNILLYVVCTLRPDHMSLYGYQRDTTPFLKKFGASGAVFEDAHAQAPWTKPSVASLLTSLHAYTHGLVNDTDTIPQKAVTLAEQLRAAGYVTAGIVANPFAGRTSGLDRGFDYMMEYPVVQRNRTDVVDRATDSAAINRQILPWLERHRGEPLFLFVQSTDPHAPYRPPADYEAKFANPAETPGFDRDYGRLRDIRAYGGGATVTRAEMRGKGVDPDRYIRQAIDRYDGETAHNDRSIELLIEKLQETEMLDDTVVVIASDHGEEFWEHGYGAHGHSLYSELIRAALLIWNPRLAPARRIREPVQLIDVMPTLLELAAVKIPEGLQGQSLVPLLKGEPFTRRETIMASKLALPQARPGGGVPENLTDSFARIERGWKMIYRAQADRARLKAVELFDRASDPADREDVSAQRSDVAARLKSEAIQWVDSQQQVRTQLGPGGKSTIDTQTLERLRSLGYVGGRK